MRVIIKGAIAVLAILFISRFLDNEENIAKLDGYKNEIINTPTVQKVINSQPVQKVQNFEFDELLPSDFF